MVCQNCGRPLPTGAQVCPNCGIPTPYNVAGSGIDPTVLSGSPSGSGMPPTAYGSQQQNYEAPPPPPDPYGAPYQANQYGTPPPPAPYPPYGAPQPQPGGYGAPPPQPKKRSRVGLIVGIVLGLVLLLCIGVFVAVYVIGKNAANNVISSVDATATADQQTVTAVSSSPTSAPTAAPTSAGAPSGNTIDATASSIITHIQMSTAIDSNDKPTNVTDTFQTNQTVYVTYDLNLSGQTGYVEVKWYIDGQLGASKIFNANNPNFTNGYFSETYTRSTQQGVAEIYWCTQSDCSDEALAGYTTFTVSGSGFRYGGSPPLAFSWDINRRD